MLRCSLEDIIMGLFYNWGLEGRPSQCCDWVHLILWPILSLSYFSSPAYFKFKEQPAVRWSSHDRSLIYHPSGDDFSGISMTTHGETWSNYQPDQTWMRMAWLWIPLVPAFVLPLYNPWVIVRPQNRPQITQL
jgi:hypothetical protein